ncbi:MAG: MBL fold metallo-hydrolase [Amphritea sp.]
MKKIIIVLLGGLIVAGIFSCSANPVKQSFAQSRQYSEGKFHNKQDTSVTSLSSLASTTWRFMFAKPANATPAQAVPLVSLTPQQLVDDNSQQTAVYRLGHSSLLLALAGDFWLIDPVFSERASPFSWAGPKRFHEVPIDPDQLPPLQGVIISHDHYDHLDKETIARLAKRAKHFIVPLGVGQYLREWGVNDSQIIELDWWQDTVVNGVQLTATPAQHFSGRGLGDRNSTLWASWVIKTDTQSLFFSGDSGYFDGFKEIGERLGPFDLTMIENGAYDKDWPDVHMTPEQTLQAHIDLRGRALMPVHNGTFDLALHAWYEPFERITDLAWNASVNLVTPKIGERVLVGEPRQNSLWWRQMVDEENTELVSAAGVE